MGRTSTGGSASKAISVLFLFRGVLRFLFVSALHKRFRLAWLGNLRNSLLGQHDYGSHGAGTGMGQRQLSNLSISQG